MQRASAAVVSTSDWPTASVRGVAICSVTGATPIPTLVVSCSATLRVGSQVNAEAAGSAISSWVEVAEVTITGVPSISTLFAEGVTPNPVPAIATTAPGVTKAGVTCEISGPPVVTGAVTRTTLAASRDSARTMIRAVPTACALTAPSGLTPAIRVALDSHESGTPRISTPFVSRAVARIVRPPDGNTNCTVSTSSRSVAMGGFTRSSASSAETEPTEARAIPVPGASASRSPSVLTASVAGVSERQSTCCPSTTWPWASRAVASACTTKPGRKVLDGTSTSSRRTPPEPVGPSPPQENAAAASAERRVRRMWPDITRGKARIGLLYTPKAPLGDGTSRAGTFRA